MKKPSEFIQHLVFSSKFFKEDKWIEILLKFYFDYNPSFYHFKSTIYAKSYWLAVDKYTVNESL